MTEIRNSAGRDYRDVAQELAEEAEELIDMVPAEMLQGRVEGIRLLVAELQAAINRSDD